MTSARVRSIRAYFGLSQGEFGKVIGVGPQHISDMERGKKAVSRTIALAILAIDAGLRDGDPTE